MKCFAIIGAGVAGLFVAQSLMRLDEQAEIAIIERSVLPYGLVRHGVAPDHQHTKKVTEPLAEILECLNFFGGVRVGVHIELRKLLEFFDAVIWAAGPDRDNIPHIAGTDLPFFWSALRFARWYNGDPESATPPLEKARNIVIIGNGNVALDIARMLAKTQAEHASSILSETVRRVLANCRPERLTLLGRRSPAEARFTPSELRELTQLRAAELRTDCARLEDPNYRAQCLALLDTRAARIAARNIEILRAHSKPLDSAAEPAPPSRSTRDAFCKIVFHFHAQPIALKQHAEQEGSLYWERSRELPERKGETVTKSGSLPAQLVISATGYVASEPPSEALNASEERRLWRAGWAAQSCRGTIPETQYAAKKLATQIVQQTDSGQRAGCEGLRAELRARAVDFQQNCLA